VPFYMGACWKMVVVHEGKEEDGGSSWGEKMKKMKVKRRVTVT
jgi:hypothetical protein